MRTYSLTHLTNGVLDRALIEVITRDHVSTAWVLAHIAEFDARKRYLVHGHPSMYSYCVHVLHLSEQAAYKRIRAARAGHRFRAVFDAVADGRVHLSAVVLLAPHFTRSNVDELLAVATWQTKAQVELMLAQRLPKPDVPTQISPLREFEPVPIENERARQGMDDMGQLSPGTVEAERSLVSSKSNALMRPELSPGTVATQADDRTPTTASPVSQSPAAPAAPARVAPLAPARFALQVTIGQGTHDKLRHAHELLGHAAAAGDVAEVLDRALDALIAQLEKRKFAATTRPRACPPPRPSGANPRHIPAHVKRTVWARDGGRCTFVGESGDRCPARTGLEYDHVEPVARGGTATVNGIRLRCRGHNQLEAERVFGSEFMMHKRESTRSAAAGGRWRASGAHAAG